MADGQRKWQVSIKGDRLGVPYEVRSLQLATGGCEYWGQYRIKGNGRNKAVRKATGKFHTPEGAQEAVKSAILTALCPPGGLSSAPVRLPSTQAPMHTTRGLSKVSEGHLQTQTPPASSMPWPQTSQHCEQHNQDELFGAYHIDSSSHGGVPYCSANAPTVSTHKAGFHLGQLQRAQQLQLQQHLALPAHQQSLFAPSQAPLQHSCNSQETQPGPAQTGPRWAADPAHHTAVLRPPSDQWLPEPPMPQATRMQYGHSVSIEYGLSSSGPGNSDLEWVPAHQQPLGQAAAAPLPVISQQQHSLVGLPVNLHTLHNQCLARLDGKYVLQQLLGEGGFAHVLRAIWAVNSSGHDANSNDRYGGSSSSQAPWPYGSGPGAAVQAAARPRVPQAAVKVFRTTSTLDSQALAKYTGRELAALRALIGSPFHVQLWAEGSVTVPASSGLPASIGGQTVPIAAVAPVAAAAGGGSKDVRMCAVLELLPETLDDLLSRWGPLSLPHVKKYI